VDFRGEPADSFSVCLPMRTRRGVSLVQAGTRRCSLGIDFVPLALARARPGVGTGIAAAALRIRKGREDALAIIDFNVRGRPRLADIRGRFPAGTAHITCCNILVAYET
jgi:hypothetical protein